MLRTCAMCGQSDSQRRSAFVFSGWIIWPSGQALCPFCRGLALRYALVRRRARELQRKAAEQRRIAASMLEWNAGHFGTSRRKRARGAA